MAVVKTVIVLKYPLKEIVVDVSERISNLETSCMKASLISNWYSLYNKYIYTFISVMYMNNT